MTVMQHGGGQELDAANDAVRFESKKVNELRRELTARAEAKIRAEARAKAVETELSVMEAGSTAMQDEVERLAAEREDLSDQLMAATGSFDEDLFSAASSPEASAESSLAPSPESDEEPDSRHRRSSEEYLPDC